MKKQSFNFYLVKTQFHGGGLISRHATLEAAEKAAKKWSVPGCTCGCCDVVTPAEYEKLPTVQACRWPDMLCRKG